MRIAAARCSAKDGKAATHLVKGLGFGVQGLGFRAQGLGFRVKGLGFRA